MMKICGKTAGILSYRVQRYDKAAGYGMTNVIFRKLRLIYSVAYTMQLTIGYVEVRSYFPE